MAFSPVLAEQGTAPRVSEKSDASRPGLARVAELSLVMPAFDEEDAIRGALEAAHLELAARCDRFEIVVVDDGSTDSTPRLLAEAARRMSELRVVTLPSNRGYAAALACGFAAARFDPVLYTDADGQFDLADLDRALPLLAAADLVAGYRARRADSWLRRFASAGYNLLARALVGVRARDVDCAFKLFRRSFLERIPIRSDGFLVDTEIYARADREGLRVAQLPVRHRPRIAGRSTVRPAAVVRSARGLLALRRTLAAEAESARAAAPRPSLAARCAPLAAPLLALALGLFAQGGRALFEPDEGRNAQIAASMLETGDWLVPRLRGEPYLDKPPLGYWIVAASLGILGRNELAARLPHALAYAGTTAAVAWLGSLLWGAAAGRRAGLAYALSLAPFLAANILTPDALLALAGALLAALVWRADHAAHLRSDAFWAAAGLVAGAGLMIKGAALLVLVAPLALALGLDHRGLGWLARRGPWVALGLALLVGLPWYAWIATELPGAAAYFLDNQVTGRLVDGRYDRNPDAWGAVRIYGPMLLLGSLPWSAIAATRAARRWLRPGARPAWTKPGPKARYVLLGLLVPVAIFAIARSRLPLYVLPVFAPIALAVGREPLLGTRLPRAARMALGTGWVVALLAAKWASGEALDRRDGERAAELVESARSTASAPVFVVDAALDSLPFYGVAPVSWATTKLEPYPVYRPAPPLAASLSEARPAEALLALPRLKLEEVRNLAQSLGYTCRERPAPERLTLLDCRREPPASAPLVRTAAAGRRPGHAKRSKLQIPLGSPAATAILPP